MTKEEKAERAAKKAAEQAFVEKLFAEGRIKTSYTVETVYSCIKKGDTLEIEDNTDKFKDLPFLTYGNAIMKK